MSANPPLGEHLREAFSDADVERIWREVDARRRRPRARVGLAIALAAAAAAVAAVTLRPAAPPARAPAAPPGPLRLADHAAIASARLEHPSDAARTVRFDDGSAVDLGPETALEPTANASDRVAFVLRRGTASFEVTPGGPRRWRVECGLATVTVVGTAFSVERAPRALRVTVSRGTVWVDGAAVPGGHRVLTAGQSLSVEAPAPREAAGPPAPPVERVERPTRAAPAPEVPAWRVRARQGDVRGAWESLGNSGFAREAAPGDPATLLALADVARRTRHHDQAAPLLERLVREHPEHPEAAMAAFTLGRDELSQRGRPALAAHWFERSLALRPPRSLVEDLRARLVEARGRAGDHAGACAAARAYLADFPQGRYADRMRGTCEGP